MQNFINWEIEVLLFIQNHLRFSFLTPIMEGFSFLGDAGWFWIVTTLILLLIPKTRKAGCISALSMLLTFLIVNMGIKPFVHRIRPYDLVAAIQPLGSLPHDYSFPSAHTANGMACSLTFIHTLPKKAGIPLLLISVMIAVSRLYVCVHYPSDVIGGFLFALIISQSVWLVMRKWFFSEKVSASSK